MSKTKQKKSHFIAVLLIMLFVIPSWTQKLGQDFIDSLKIDLEKTMVDTLRIDLLLNLSDAYSYIDPNQGTIYGRQAVQLAEQFKDPFRLQHAYSVLGINFDNKSDYSRAAESYFTALKWGEQSGNKRGQAADLSNLAGVLIKDKSYIKALEYLKNAVKINQEINEFEFLSINYINIGVIYTELKKLDSAKIHLIEALRIVRELKNFINESIVLTNLALIWIEEKKYEQALLDLTRAQNIAKANKDDYMNAVLTAMIGSLYAHVALDTLKIRPFPLNKNQAFKLALNLLIQGSQMCENMGIQDEQG